MTDRIRAILETRRSEAFSPSIHSALQESVKPVYVSVGHRVSLANACAHTLHLARDYRLPETTRRADALCRTALREATSAAAGS